MLGVSGIPSISPRIIHVLQGFETEEKAHQMQEIIYRTDKCTASHSVYWTVSSSWALVSLGLNFASAFGFGCDYSGWSFHFN